MPKKYTVKNRKHGGESKLYQYLKKVPETMTKYRCKNISSTLNRFKEKEVCPETIKEFVNSYLSKYSTIEDMIIENSYKLDDYFLFYNYIKIDIIYNHLKQLCPPVYTIYLLILPPFFLNKFIKIVRMTIFNNFVIIIIS